MPGEGARHQLPLIDIVGARWRVKIQGGQLSSFEEQITVGFQPDLLVRHRIRFRVKAVGDLDGLAHR